MVELGLGLAQFETFLDSLNVPGSCVINKPLYKKMFQEHASLDAKDKRALKDDVVKIRWLYTLKPSTINIAPYHDELRDYGEMAFLHVELSNTKNSKSIGQLIDRAIPYPLVIFFTYACGKFSQSGVNPAASTSANEEQLALCVAGKRLNKADKDKWVIEDTVCTDWINLHVQTNEETAFLQSLSINNLPFKNFWEFQKSITERAIAINCAKHSGTFMLADTEKIGDVDRLANLKELERLEVQRSELANKLKKEKQMGRQVELNTRIKKIKDQVSAIKGSL